MKTEQPKTTYSTNSHYVSGQKKGLPRPLRGAPIKKDPYRAIYDYILDAIDSSGYDIEASTPKEKLEFLADTFSKEYGWMVERYGHVKAMCEWLQGLPSSSNIDFYNHAILALAKKWGRLEEGASTKKEDSILKNWFPFIAMRIGELMREYGVEYKARGQL